MEITFYQINMDRDYSHMVYRSYDSLTNNQGSAEIDSEIYDKVFKGSVACDTIEDVYRVFNDAHPDGYSGRFLSVSDVIEITDKDTGKHQWYYCDSIGFKQIIFDPELTEDLKEQKIQTIYCEPGKLAVIKKIENELSALQSAVGGNIEAFYPFEEMVCIVCNEEGKINGMEPNRAVFSDDGKILDVIFGPFFICDCSGQNFGSLSQDQLTRYEAKFRHPEKLFKIGNEIVSVPYCP